MNLRTREKRTGLVLLEGGEKRSQKKRGETRKGKPIKYGIKTLKMVA